ncbi:hypothetical protein [Parafilimonas sp.]|uniref:hypothetical protein n=1 Tax=Parafilimonas sp. TaxID=1969739 RepID=UPI0039E5B82E
MNKKVIAGAVVALAAGIATFIYRRNKNKIDEYASDAYNELGDEMRVTEDRLETAFS